jgi:hypothetical protein
MQVDRGTAGGNLADELRRAVQVASVVQPHATAIYLREPSEKQLRKNTTVFIV